MKGLSLIEAMCNITTEKQITAIQYADGSGFKFNYQLDHGEWQFIDLSEKEEIIEIYDVSGLFSTVERIMKRDQMREEELD